jgi:hypothetical protein
VYGNGRQMAAVDREPRSERREPATGEGRVRESAEDSSLTNELEPFANFARGAAIGLARALLTNLGRETGEAAIDRRRRRRAPRSRGGWRHEDQPWTR